MPLKSQDQPHIYIPSGFNADVAPVCRKMACITAVGNVFNSCKYLQVCVSDIDRLRVQGQVEARVPAGFLFSFGDLILSGCTSQDQFRGTYPVMGIANA